MAAFPSNTGFYAAPSTSGWFQNSAATNVQMYPVYYPAPAAEPEPQRRRDPLDWLRDRVQECVDLAVLA